VSPTEYQELVAFLAHRFEEVDRRFGEQDARFDGIAGQITELRLEMLGHLDAIYRRLERLEQEYQAITQALRRIEAALAGEGRRREIVERDLAELKSNVAALQSRIAAIEQRLAE
jgi:chromosome segregation ATPase